VLYLVENQRTAQAIERAARRAGIASRVHVQLVRFAPGSGAIGAGRGTDRPDPSRERRAREAEPTDRAARDPVRGTHR
jgi:hypothetical protein